MLEDNIKSQLGSYLEKLQRPIELVATLDESAASLEMRGLIDDIASLSSKVSARFDGLNARAPSFTVGEPGASKHAGRITFAGLPMGHEFTSLILALLQTGGHPPKVEPGLIEQIRSIDRDLNFEIYVSLECHNCPDVVQALNLMAVLNPRITSVMIEGGLYRAEVEAKNVLAVPMVFLNGEHLGQGRMSLEEILAKVSAGDTAMAALVEQQREALAAKAPYEVLVVGGGPAGAAAAIYAARKGIRTGIVAERFGGQVMDTMGIENFISVEYTEGPKLVAAMEQHVKQYGVDIVRGQRVSGLTAAASPGALAQVHLDNGASLSARAVIVATGARWREMGVPGEQEYKGRGVCFCPHCDGPLFKGKRVAVIGGGNSGVEAAIDLAGIVAHVTVIEFDTQLRADAVLQTKLRSLPNVEVILHAQTLEVTGADTVNGLRYKDRTSNTEHALAIDGLFVQIGLLPNTDFAKDTVTLSKHREIEVNARCETSATGIFAAGDCTTVPYKQIIISMGEGSKAALTAFDYLIRHSAP
jgi:NADH-dependent peroxiredoxin subunit F